MQITSECRVVVLLHHVLESTVGKTGLAFLRYSNANIVAVIDVDNSNAKLVDKTGIDRDIPIVSCVDEAMKFEPNIVVIGAAPYGGTLSNFWWAEIERAIAHKLSIINGLHIPLSHQYSNFQPGQWIWDVRHQKIDNTIASAKARNLACERILTIGTDMSVGKMSASLEILQAARKSGIKTEFLATGQTGIVISGKGVPLDAVKIDFAAGAVEKLALNLGENSDLLLIEGQGSLLHPASSATLPLLRGSQPTGLLMAHRAGQKFSMFSEHTFRVPIPPLREVIQMYEILASAGGIFSTPKVRAIALNTHHLSEKEAIKHIHETEDLTHLPCTDPVRFGGQQLLDVCFEKRLNADIAPVA